MRFSIVTTLYNTSDYLEDFMVRCQSLLPKLPIESFEYILVDDGSRVDQIEKAKSICKKFNNVFLVCLSRNFGHHPAILKGLEQSSGDLVFLIDSDLEEDPADCLKLFDEFKTSQADVVFGYQERRRGGVLERASGYIFYFLMRNLMKIDISENLMTSRLMSRRYVNALLSYSESQINFSGLALLTGFRQTSIPLKKLRLRETSYSFSKKITLLVDAITSFSSTPLKLIFGVGFLIFSVASTVISFLAVRLLIGGSPASGWVSLIVSIWFLGGLIMLSLGILGIYISRIFMETKNRPRTIVKELLVFKGEE